MTEHTGSILSDEVLDLIAPKLPEALRDKSECEEYIDHILVELDKEACRKGYYGKSLMSA